MSEPKTRTIRGDIYQLIVFKVVGRDEHGRPRKLETLYDEESTKIDGGEEFLTAYVPEKCVRKRAN